MSPPSRLSLSLLSISASSLSSSSSSRIDETSITGFATRRLGLLPDLLGLGDDFLLDTEALVGGEEDEDCWSAARAGEVEDAAGDPDSVTAVVPPAVVMVAFGVRRRATMSSSWPMAATL